jgi:transposase-like protein
METREIRGLAIISKGDTPINISKEKFLVPSQSSGKKYNVTHLDGWSCSCPDFQKRGLECKHIHATKFFLKLRNKEEVNGFDVAEAVNKPECPKCKSSEVVKAGQRKNKNGVKQKLQCSECKHYFVQEPIKYVKANAKVVMLTLDLYYKGLSLRDVSDTVKQFYGIKLHHETVRRWINKFSKMMNDYTSQFKPSVSGQWHSDEQMVKVKGEWKWAWNVIDAKSRFLIANNLTEQRGVKDARAIIRKAKRNAGKKPDYFITDNLGAYPRAFRKEIGAGKRKMPMHIQVKHIKHRVNNNLIERYHNDFREFDKVRRGFKSKHTTEQWLEGFRLYHNFVKENTTLGKTPAEQAKINLNLDENKWLSLLEKSLAKQ